MTNVSRWEWTLLMEARRRFEMATGSKMDWRGACDGTPSARPTDPDKEPERGHAKGGDWKGMDGGTPSARPTDPNKE